jgi:hypothetical protein
MHPVVLALTILTCLAILLLPRRHIFAPLILMSILLPVGEELYWGGLHFYSTRLMAIVAIVRLSYSKWGLEERILPGGFLPIDQAVYLLVFYKAVVFSLRVHAMEAVINQVAAVIDVCSFYTIFRYSLAGVKPVVSALRALVVMCVLLAIAMIFERQTQFNPFNLIRVEPMPSLMRVDHIRAQGPFANSITAGCVGATMIPIAFWLLKWRRGRLWGVAGMASAAAIVFACNSSTPVSTALGGAVALGFWPLRTRMREVRWALLCVILVLALVMKAPVWFLIARVDFVGGHGWDRAYLIDQFVRHFGDWWLAGTMIHADWGESTWDTCNQFVSEAATGGMVALAIFLVLLYQIFRALGKARARLSGSGKLEWLAWSMGCTVVANLFAFQGVSYFDQTRIWWLALVAMIPAVCERPYRRSEKDIGGVKQDPVGDGADQKNQEAEEDSLQPVSGTRVCQIAS